MSKTAKLLAKARSAGSGPDSLPLELNPNPDVLKRLSIGSENMDLLAAFTGSVPSSRHLPKSIDATRSFSSHVMPYHWHQLVAAKSLGASLQSAQPLVHDSFHPFAWPVLIAF
jgi:hypothetical protein